MLTRRVGPDAAVNQIETGVAEATNDVATVTFLLQGGTRLQVTRVCWSYSADPTGGGLSMTGVSVPPELDITKGGPGALSFDAAFALKATTVTVSLAAGGGGVVGKLYVEAIRTPA